MNDRHPVGVNLKINEFSRRILGTTGRGLAE
jgi:hypothetical protein